MRTTRKTNDIWVHGLVDAEKPEIHERAGCIQMSVADVSIYFFNDTREAFVEAMREFLEARQKRVEAEVEAMMNGEEEVRK